MTQHVRRGHALRLPWQLAAQLGALQALHPQVAEEQLIADVLTIGLAAVRQAHGEDAGTALPTLPDVREAVYLLTGPFAAFHGLVRKHHLAREQTLAPHENPPPVDPYALDQPD